MTDKTVGVDSAFPFHVPKLHDGFQFGFSKREMAAIMLRIPDSGIKWLDEMIVRSHKLSPNVTADFYKGLPK